MSGYNLTGAEFYDLLNDETPAGIKALKFNKSASAMVGTQIGSATSSLELVGFNTALAWDLSTAFNFGVNFQLANIADAASYANVSFNLAQGPFALSLNGFFFSLLVGPISTVLTVTEYDDTVGYFHTHYGASFNTIEILNRDISIICEFVPVLNTIYTRMYFDSTAIIQDEVALDFQKVHVLNYMNAGWTTGTPFSVAPDTSIDLTLSEIWLNRADIQPIGGFSSDDYYKKGLQGLLPSGRAWNRDPDSNLSKVLKSIADELAIVDYRALNIIDEVDPRGAIELIKEHEDDLGLPDDIYSIGDSLPDRQAAALAKLTAKGGNSKQYFIDLAADVFDMTITITFFTPFWSGVGCSGDPCGDQQNIFYWKVTTYFDVLHEKYRDAMIRVFELLKPAHTVIIWDYDAEYDWSYSTAFDAIPARLTDWLEGAFDKAFSIAFDRRSGGGFSHEAFSWDEFDTEH